MNIVKKAKRFAIKYHRGQVRKNDTDKPYIIHPIEVSNILSKYGYDENVVAAGLLHDTLEDTKAKISDIKRMFGDDILSLILGDSEEDKKLSWEIRKKGVIDKVKMLDIRHKAVVCADKISNLSDMLIKFRIYGEDYHAFKRGKDKQKWYYENIYNSLIYNEDNNNEMFKELYDLIRKVFYNEEDEFVKNNIFNDNIEYYNKLVVINYKGLELVKLKDVCDIKPFVIEFTGTPRTFKTTIIKKLSDFLKKSNFKIEYIDEYTKSNTYKKLDGFDKMNIADSVLNNINKSISKNPDIVIVDRGLFDILILLDRFYCDGYIDICMYNSYKNKYVSLINKENIIICTYCDSIVSLKRDYYDKLSLDKRRFLSVDNVVSYNKSLNNVKDSIYNICLFDGNLDDCDEMFVIVNKILDEIKQYYVKYVNDIFR